MPLGITRRRAANSSEYRRPYAAATRCPTLDDTERAPDLDREGPPDELKHWSKVDRWQALGREVGLLKLEAKRQAKSIHDLPGAPSKIAEFLELGRELQRSSR